MDIGMSLFDLTTEQLEQALPIMAAAGVKAVLDGQWIELGFGLCGAALVLLLESGQTTGNVQERLAARAERMPRGEALLQPQAQRLDDLTERLRRGLRDCAAQGRERLGSQRLSPATLERSLRNARQMLTGARLQPALLQRPLADRRAQLVSITRLAQQLHPDRPLQRGYVRVTDAQGRTLTARADAAREALLKLNFHDGTLDAVPAGTAPPRRAAPAAPKRAHGADQPKLL